MKLRQFFVVLLVMGALSAAHAQQGGGQGMAQFMSQRMQELDALMTRIGAEDDAAKRQTLIGEYRKKMQSNIDMARRMMRARRQSDVPAQAPSATPGQRGYGPAYGQRWMPQYPGFARPPMPRGAMPMATANKHGHGKKKHRGRFHKETKAQLDRIETMLKQLTGAKGQN